MLAEAFQSKRTRRRSARGTPGSRSGRPPSSSRAPRSPPRSGCTVSRARRVGGRPVARHRSVLALLRRRALPRRSARSAARWRLSAGAQPGPRRVLLTAPLLDVRRDDARRRRRHADGLPRPGDDVDRCVRDDRVPPRVAQSSEGALKYFLLGSFAAAILVYGFVLLYGVTGHTDLAGIRTALASGAVK